MARRHQDHYARDAKAQGFRARSVFKLEEIDTRVRLLAPGARVLDLGCAPGSWLQYTARAVGPRGRVVGVDLQVVAPLGLAQVQTHVVDVFAADDAWFEAAGAPFDVVLSDMAPSTTGSRTTDHARSVELCRRALGVAARVLRPGGSFVCKVFEGEDVAALVSEVQVEFGEVKRIKPKGTRTESTELFVVARGRRARGVPAVAPAGSDGGPSP